MKKAISAQQKLDEIRAKNAERAAKFKERQEEKGLVRVALWIPAELKAHVDKNGYKFVVGYSSVETDEVPAFLNGEWRMGKCAKKKEK